MLKEHIPIDAADPPIDVVTKPNEMGSPLDFNVTKNPKSTLTDPTLLALYHLTFLTAVLFRSDDDVTPPSLKMMDRVIPKLLQGSSLHVVYTELHEKKSEKK